MIILKKRFKSLKEPNIPTREDLALKAGEHKLIKLNFNESTYGPSPKVLNFNFQIKEPQFYPEYGARNLLVKLEELYHLSIDHFWISNGSDAILDAIPSLFVSRQQANNIIIPKLTYNRINQTAIVRGIKTKKIPLKNGGIDLEATLAAIDKDTKIIYLVNPNMPTGVLHSQEVLINFLNRVPSEVLIVLDEAYIEFAHGVKTSFTNSRSLIKQYSNILITRTMSKLFGLAAYRIGYVISNPTIINLFAKAIQSMPITQHSSEYAIQALNDIPYYEKVVQIVNFEKDKIYHFLNNINFKYYFSGGNFIFINLSQKTFSNKLFCEFLLTNYGIAVRPVEDFGVRITVGRPIENDQLIVAIKSFLKQYEN